MQTSEIVNENDYLNISSDDEDNLYTNNYKKQDKIIDEKDLFGVSINLENQIYENKEDVKIIRDNKNDKNDLEEYDNNIDFQDNDNIDNNGIFFNINRIYSY